MERIFKIFSREYNGINSAAFLLGLFALLSQILGLFRDRAIAHFIGPSPFLDVYYASFRIPDFIFISIASLASVTVLVPFIVSYLAEDNTKEKAQDFLNNIFTAFLLLLIFVAILVFFLMPFIVFFIVPGFSFSMQKEVVEISRIMLLSPIFMGLSSLFSSITQLYKKFFLYALSPIFYNLGIIIGVLFLYPFLGIKGLALGVILGAFMHFLIQFFSASSCGFNLNFKFPIDFKNLKEIVFISLPRTLGLSFNNIALIFIVSFASYMHAGSISIFNFSLNLQFIPLGIIGLSYAVAAFPTLTKSFTKEDKKEFKDQLRDASCAIIFWSLPLTFLFIVLRAQIVRVILGTGFFSWNDTRLVAASFAIFSISILAQGLIALFARAYYASGNTRRPLIINFISSVSIIIFSYIFLKIFNYSNDFRYFIESLLKVDGISGTEVLMLPLAYSLGTILNFSLLWFFIKRDFMKKEEFILKTFLQCLVSSFVVGLITYISLNFFASYFDLNKFWGILLQGVFSGIFGIIAGFIILYLFGNKELKKIIITLKMKFWKTKDLVVSSQEGI